MTNWDKILADFAHKCGDGGPDMTNPRHLALLRESLLKFGWKEFATNEFIGNLREAKKGDDLQKVPAGFTKTKKPKYYFINPQPKAGKSPIHDLTDETGKKRKWKYATKDEVEYSKSLSGLVTQKGKSKEKKKESKPGDPVNPEDSFGDQHKQADANLTKAEEAYNKSKVGKDDKQCEADKTCKKKKKEYEDAKYQKEQFDEIAKIMKSKPPKQKDGEPDDAYAERVKKYNRGVGEAIQGLIDQSLKRVRGEDGTVSKAEPGGIAASNGESSCCEAANALSEDWEQNRIGSNQDHTGVVIESDAQQKAYEEETTTRREDYGIELGLVETSDEDEDNPPGYKPSQEHVDRAKEKMKQACSLEQGAPSTPECDAAVEEYYKAEKEWEDKQKEIGLELEKRKRWVAAERGRIMEADPGSQIKKDIKTAEDKVTTKCGGKDLSLKNPPSKESLKNQTCKDAWNSLRDKEKNLKEWLETGYDTGRSMIDDVVHDRHENCEWEDGKLVDEDCKGEYNAPPGFPNDEKNKENGTPRSAIMSPEMQALFRGQLEKKLAECEGDTKCEEHYRDQLDNFEEGLSDHDTGMMYYDADGNLRFVNISNKKTKDGGTGGIDPQYNGTPASREEAVMKAIDSMIEENKKAEEEDGEPEFPGFTGELGRQVGSRLVKGYKKAYDLATDAKRKVTTLEVEDEVHSEMSGSVGTGPDAEPSTDAQLMGGEDPVTGTRIPDLLPPGRAKGGGRKYVTDVRKHKKTQDKLVKLFGPKGPYSDEQVIAAAIELMKEGDVPYKPFGKLIEKYGEVYNDIKIKSTEKDEMVNPPDPEPVGQGWSPARIAKKYNISEGTIDGILKNKAMQDCGKLKARRQAAMAEAHKEIVNATKKQDQAWFNTPKGTKWAEANGWVKKGKKWVEQTPGSGKNGPYTQTYVREYMNNLHWDRYIENLDGKKQLQVGGINCKPKDLRECLAKLSGFTDDPPKGAGPEPKDPEERKVWRKKLLAHLEEKVDIDADTGAVRIKGADGASIGYDTWRTAGESPKSAAGPGMDLRKCVRKKNNTRQVKRRNKK